MATVVMYRKLKMHSSMNEYFDLDKQISMISLTIPNRDSFALLLLLLYHF